MSRHTTQEPVAAGCLRCMQVLVKVMPMGLFRTYSAVIRGLNNIVGGMSFVTIARLFGVQKSGSATSASAVLRES